MGVIKSRIVKVFALLTIASSCAFSQVDSVYVGDPSKTTQPEKKKTRDWYKPITFGGDFQAWVGNPTFIMISPVVGYTFLKNFNAGVGGVYSYMSVDYGSYGKFSQSVWGGHSYLRYIIAENYFVQLQYDKLHQPLFYGADPSDYTWIDYVMVGGGFRQRISPHAALTSSIMYNLTPHPLSIYATRLLLQFGFVGNL